MRLIQHSLNRLANVASGGQLDRLNDGLVATLTQLKESSREIERLKEDTIAGWTRLSDEQRAAKRQVVRNNCRYAFQKGDPFIKGALKLMTEFVFEQGIDGPISEDTATQTALDEFWFAPDNQEVLFSTVAQHRASNQLLVDGDYFAIVRAGSKPSNHTAIRHMPAVYVMDTVTDPFDLTRVLYYRCKVPDLTWDAGKNEWVERDEKKTVFYRDIFNVDETNDPLSDTLGAVAEKDAYLLHLAINAIDAGGFGWPEPAVSLRWFDAHSEIVEDQVTLSRMSAALMTKLKVIADSTAIDTLRDQIRDRGQWDNGEANENVAGQFNLFNEQVELSVNRASTMATDAGVNARMLHMGGVVGLGIPLHYSGDPDNAGLATARTMDRPSLVHMRAYQSVWIDGYRKLIDFFLAQRGIKNAEYDLPAPRIARQDISEAGKLIMDADDRGLLTRNQSSSSVLDLLGFDDIAKELQILEDEMEAEDEAETTPLETEPEEESEW